MAELLRLLGKGEKLKIAFNERRAAFQIETGKDTSGLTRQHLSLFEGGGGQLSRITSRSSPRRPTSASSWSASCSCSACIARRWSPRKNPTRLRSKLRANLLEITASSPDFGESHESMAISYSGPELQVAFNPQFVMDPLRALTKDEVFFEAEGRGQPRGLQDAGELRLRHHAGAPELNARAG